MMTTFLATFMMQLIPEPSECPLHIVIAQGFFEMNYVNRKDPPSSGIVLNLWNWFSRFYVLGLYDLGWGLIRTQAIQFQNYTYVLWCHSLHFHIYMGLWPFRAEICCQPMLKHNNTDHFIGEICILCKQNGEICKSFAKLLCISISFSITTAICVRGCEEF